MNFLSKLLPAGVLAGLMLAVVGACSPAQDPIPLFPPGGAQPGAQADPNAPPEGTEVLARGPVHEAFATTAETPTAAPVVAKQPPDPVEELPPDQKPEGDNVQWIPGYWHWDEDSSQFIWISGFWRDPPPGRLWVPGSWREVQGGWQWVSGFWQTPSVEQPQQPEVQYLPEPPATLELGPSNAAPTATSFYVPGSWVWRNKYVWRPGVWVEYRANWVWVPAHFCRTPIGFVFVDGYWDYTLAHRGVLYAPVTFTRAVYTRPGFVYTPLYAVSEPALVGALFVRHGYGNYYFGDYFEKRYVTAGYNPWSGRVTNNAFAIGFGTGRTWGYDPLWSYYSATHRTDREWNTRVNDLYTGRYTGKVARPPVSLTQQNTVINNITNTTTTNVTNNITVVNKTVTVNKQNVTDVAMLAPTKVIKDLQPEVRIKPITAQVRKDEGQHARQIREVAVQRNKVETAAAAARPMGTKPAEQPQTLKLDVPKVAVTRTQVKDEKKAPPPPAHKVEAAIDPKPDPKVLPKVEPKVDPKPKVEPKTEPKPKVDPPKPPVVPPPTPKVEPKPKDPIPEPKPKVDPPKPPVVPPPNPKVDPPKPPVVPPKIEPKPPVVPPPTPKVEPKPKVDPPKPPVVPPPNPKVEPPKPPVVPPVIPPKIEPKSPVVPPPNPKVEPPKPPVVPPKTEPKKKDPPMALEPIARK